jgi:hypothetical protein
MPRLLRHYLECGQCHVMFILFNTSHNFEVVRTFEKLFEDETRPRGA